jgi:hypothetical protein
MMLDRWDDVTLELGKEIFMTLKSECQLEGVFKEQLDGAL